MNPIDPDQNHWRERLSDYLDNRLDGAERAEIEQLIQGEDESKEHGLRAQLDQMRYFRDSLKQLAARDVRQQLDSGFADRVLEASITRAIDEGADSDHPLIRLASQPGSSSLGAASSPNRRLWNRKTVAVVLSIAASTALAVFVAGQNSATPNLASNLNSLSSQDSLGNQPRLLAQNDAMNQEVPPFADSTSDPMPAKETSVGNLISPPLPTEIALAASTDRSMKPESIGPTVTKPPSIAAPKLASVDPSERAIVDSTVAIIKDTAPTKLAAIMVLEIKQTESGRVVGAVRRAMKAAGIRRDDEKSLTAEIAKAASQTVGLDGDEMVSMVYLQASAKSIDQFYVNLFDDREGVKSVSLAIATNAPVLELVNAVDIVDATTVASDTGSATMLPGSDGPLNDLTFSEVSRESMQGMTLSSGPDFAAQLLVVIR